LTKQQLLDREEELRSRPRVRSVQARGSVAEAIEDVAKVEEAIGSDNEYEPAFKKHRGGRWVPAPKGRRQIYLLTLKEATEAWLDERGEEPGGNSPWSDEQINGFEPIYEYGRLEFYIFDICKGQSNDAAKDAICFNCNKKGHYAKDCWSAKGAKTNSSTSSTTNDTCHNCGKPGHYAKDCRSRRTRSASIPFRPQILERQGPPTALKCYNCGKPGHTANVCRSRSTGLHNVNVHNHSRLALEAPPNEDEAVARRNWFDSNNGK